MTGEDWQIVGFTAGMALLATLLVLPPGILLAWLLARGRWPGKTLLETLVSLPLVLPPVVTGLLLLRLLGRKGPVGKWLWETQEIEIVFTWKAVVIALAVMSLPLLVRTARTAFEEVDGQLEQQARTLGAGESRVFFSVTLPLARRGVWAGVLLAFARALGEFGATVMIAGNIPGETTTLSVAIYNLVQLGQDDKAWTFAGISASIAFLAVAASERLSRRRS
ncbi:MAG: molybdate ABC transporter permease subunit [Akkermansiaceae bacterium]|nr:molybdate ABC transporter permease subunit [Akkermansiaceae bacterium]MCP5543218.1 molybdate ABC transporter permease subunit [Akkermansiaceae bacterium]MCP5546298.1 molybdate ABC transporter permease subunit [Akkermansiaceae bacterium]